MNTHEAVNILTAFHSVDNLFLSLDNPPLTDVSESDLSTVQGHSDERHTPNIFAAAQAVLSPPQTGSVSFDLTSSNDSSAENTSGLSRESDRNDIVDNVCIALQRTLNEIQEWCGKHKLTIFRTVASSTNYGYN